MTTVTTGCSNGHLSIANPLRGVNGVALHVSAVARAAAWKHVCDGVSVGDWGFQHRASYDRMLGQRSAMADVERVGARNGLVRA